VTELVALLRGINLGRHNRISMASLRELLADAGFEDVRTHLQSGNVVLSTTSAPAEAGRAIEEAISGRLGLSIDVIIRTGQELAEVVAAKPLGDVATDPSKHFVVFMPGEPDSAVMRELAAEDFSPDRFSARGRELYVWCPDGMRDSRLMKLLTRRRVAETSTVRNWNTVTKLLEMVRATD
jgi:uncharacterized protein (DUF1697 family)